MDEIFKKAEENGLKVVFGLEAQGHLPTIEKILKKWNDGNDYDNDMTYSKHVWDEIGKEIGWCPFAACLYYFRYLNSEKDKELGVLKGAETGKSTHRCSHCENFYADEENILDEFNGDLVCNDCLINALKERNSELESDLEGYDILKRQARAVVDMIKYK